MDSMKISGGQKTSVSAIPFALVVGLPLLIFIPLLGSLDLHAPAFWIALFLLAILSIFSVTPFLWSKSVVLLSSSPPVLVKTTTWLGKYTAVVEEKLEGAAWVQVSSNWGFDAPSYLSVEIVQPGRWATVIQTFDDSSEGLEQAKKKCTEIARFLGLEDKGHRA